MCGGCSEIYSCLERNWFPQLIDLLIKTFHQVCMFAAYFTDEYIPLNTISLALLHISMTAPEVSILMLVRLQL